MSVVKGVEAVQVKVVVLVLAVVVRMVVGVGVVLVAVYCCTCSTAVVVVANLVYRVLTSLVASRSLLRLRLCVCVEPIVNDQSIVPSRTPTIGEPGTSVSQPLACQPECYTIGNIGLFIVQAENKVIIQTECLSGSRVPCSDVITAKPT